MGLRPFLIPFPPTALACSSGLAVLRIGVFAYRATGRAAGLAIGAVGAAMPGRPLSGFLLTLLAHFVHGLSIMPACSGAIERQPQGKKKMESLANFLFETGMLKRTPRSGFQFLGSGAESVAEHIFRTACIGYVLGRTAENVDTDRILRMCLFHDLPEARTGDLNYVNKKYVAVDEEKAVADMTGPLPFGGEIREAIAEFNRGETPEAALAKDADQIEMILALKEYKDLGSPYAQEWIDFALRRLKTDAARSLAETILTTDSTAWWFSDKGDWWVKGKTERISPPPDGEDA